MRPVPMPQCLAHGGRAEPPAAQARAADWMQPPEEPEGLSRYVQILRERIWIVVVALIRPVAIVYVPTAHKVYEAEADLLICPLRRPNPALIGLRGDRGPPIPPATSRRRPGWWTNLDVAERVQEELDSSQTPRSSCGKVRRNRSRRATSSPSRRRPTRPRRPTSSPTPSPTRRSPSGPTSSTPDRRAASRARGPRQAGGRTTCDPGPDRRSSSTLRSGADPTIERRDARRPPDAPGLAAARRSASPAGCSPGWCSASPPRSPPRSSTPGCVARSS